jgi:hypothetical protein
MLTTNFGVVYLKEREKMKILGYSDSDMTGDVDDRKSISGMAYFFGKSPISWLS